MYSAVYEGWVRHRRRAPRAHAFRQRLFMVFVDLDELGHCFAGNALWSVEKGNLASFRRRDYLGDTHRPLAEAVRDRVEERTGTRPVGPIRMLTHLRYFGYCYNPVTFYYVYDAADTALEAVVAEIENTPWKERHAYVLPRSEAGSLGRLLQWRFAKDFHVSPFMPMDVEHDWRFEEPGQRLLVHMVNQRRGEAFFDATLVLRRRPIEGGSLDRLLLSYPFMTLRVLGGIYLHALWLWGKKTPFHRHPARGAAPPERNRDVRTRRRPPSVRPAGPSLGRPASAGRPLAAVADRGRRPSDS